MKLVAENRFSGKTYFYTIASRAWKDARPVGRQSQDVPLSDRHVVLFKKINIKEDQDQKKKKVTKKIKIKD